jgi:hypothetical protein
MLSFGRIRTTLPIDVAIMIGVGVLNGGMMGGLGVVCLKRRSVVTIPWLTHFLCHILAYCPSDYSLSMTHMLLRFIIHCLLT